MNGGDKFRFSLRIAPSQLSHDVGYDDLMAAEQSVGGFVEWDVVTGTLGNEEEFLVWKGVQNYHDTFDYIKERFGALFVELLDRNNTVCFIQI